MAAVLGDEKPNQVSGRDHAAPGDMDEKRSVTLNGSPSEDIGVARDGMKLHPQPTADPLDPLNWSSAKKHTILAIVMYL
jgi:hypothetical protein